MAEQPPLTREQQIAALGILPEGSNSRYVYNRMSVIWEGQFDGKMYVFQPHEHRAIPAEVAERLYYTQSIIPGTLRHKLGGGGTLTTERALALGPGWKIAGTQKVEDTYILLYEPAEADPEFLVPTETKPSLDYFDRTSIPNYVERPNVRDQGAAPTHAAILPV